MSYSYYDTPEGQDCFEKMWYLSKIAGAAGIGISSLDVLLYSKPKGYMNTIARYGHYTVPFVSMAVAFTATTCLATTIRKKDDKFNYFLGGAASGVVAGAFAKKGVFGLVCVLGFGTVGFLKRLSIEEGWTFINQPKKWEYGSLHLHDYTILQKDKK